MMLSMDDSRPTWRSSNSSVDPRAAAADTPGNTSISSASSVLVTPPPSSSEDDVNDDNHYPPLPPPLQHTKTIFLVRHAEAEHNILEKRAIEEAIARGMASKCEQERARRAILQNPSLRDSPLSKSGQLQVRQSSRHLQELLRVSNGGGSREEESSMSPSLTSSSSSTTSSKHHFRQPQVVLVSPLRRALMTATELFHNKHGAATGDDCCHDAPPPRFVALEVLREKRTGLACDERSSVYDLQEDFPHVDFMDLTHSVTPEQGEDNALVRLRTQQFLEEVLINVPETVVSIVSHKGWLRELRHTLKSRVDEGYLKVDFDVKEWHQTLYRNAEIRIAEFGYDRQDKLVSIVSRSVDNAIVACAHNQEEEERGEAAVAAASIHNTH